MNLAILQNCIHLTFYMSSSRYITTTVKISDKELTHGAFPFSKKRRGQAKVWEDYHNHWSLMSKKSLARHGNIDLIHTSNEPTEALKYYLSTRTKSFLTTFMLWILWPWLAIKRNHLHLLEALYYSVDQNNLVIGSLLASKPENSKVYSFSRNSSLKSHIISRQNYGNTTIFVESI